MKTREIIKIAARACRTKKAKDIIALDMRGLSSVADYFFICSAENTRQVKAIVDEVEEALRKAGSRASWIEGFPEARWVVMDYGVILIHVFLAETRAYYSLETLWGDAPRTLTSGEDNAA
ncbi:MAG: ribosome silencing factor [Candidatus Euphemobacter frigidus]|nr:ribosome silencing factor [Candidatus Euphemobacter frigidus]MDP8275062.1 ribosome silencing factor [Candidatus Euphemobacter frigidus]